MHVGGPNQKTASGRAIHWHADPNVRIEYITTDEDRQTIPFVRTINEKGETKEYVVAGTTPEALVAGTTRRWTSSMPQCRRASNRAHRRTGLNRAMPSGQIIPALPFVRREAVRLLKSDYPDEAAAAAAIESGFRAVYDASKGVHQSGEAVTGHRCRAPGVSATSRFGFRPWRWAVFRDSVGPRDVREGCFRCRSRTLVARGRAQAMNANAPSC